MNPVQPQYAVWSEPVSALKVKYALPLFHELDFQVNEGYRRIPHGGIEIGGVLYGRVEREALSIEAFRSIDCEHASGPSFSLSDRDLANLAESFSTAQSDAELKGLERIGWFVSHTRSGLQMSDREIEIFDRYFPGLQRITLLVKPERFQPTRFVFCVRGPNGLISRGDPRQAIILPLPGRAGNASQPISSIPAPVDKEAAADRLTGSGPAVPRVNQSPYEPNAGSGSAMVPISSGAIANPFPSVDEIRKRRSEHLRNSIAHQSWRTKFGERAAIQRKPAKGSLALVLFLASLLGCASGYWAYLQLPPATITLHVEKLSPSRLQVRWPAEQTKNSSLAVIRIDDGQPTTLTDQQKASGQVEVNPTFDETKIELIFHHSIRDSRGIIRYVRLPVPIPPAKAKEERVTQTPRAVLPLPEVLQER